MNCAHKNLIAVSKDGEWGKGEPFANSAGKGWPQAG